MSDLNFVLIGGWVCQNPNEGDLRYMQNGNCIFKFSMASSRSVKNGEQWENRPIFVNVTTFGSLAERLKDKMYKGVEVVVQGRLDQDRWQDKETQKSREKIYIVADTVKVLSSAQQSQQPNFNNNGYAQGQEYQQEFPSDIPFGG